LAIPSFPTLLTRQTQNTVIMAPGRGLDRGVQVRSGLCFVLLPVSRPPRIHPSRHPSLCPSNCSSPLSHSLAHTHTHTHTHTHNSHTTHTQLTHNSHNSHNPQCILTHLPDVHSPTSHPHLQPSHQHGLGAMPPRARHCYSRPSRPSGARLPGPHDRRMAPIRHF